MGEVIQSVVYDSHRTDVLAAHASRDFSSLANGLIEFTIVLGVRGVAAGEEGPEGCAFWVTGLFVLDNIKARGTSVKVRGNDSLSGRYDALFSLQLASGDGGINCHN